MPSYQITFTLKTDEEDEILIEESVTTLLDEEVNAHENGSTRCGVHFADVWDVKVQRVE